GGSVKTVLRTSSASGLTDSVSTRRLHNLSRIANGTRRRQTNRRSAEGSPLCLALGRSRRRPPRSALPTGLQRDIRAFFGSYSAGCRRADDRLFRAGDAAAVDHAGRRSAVGKLLPDALFVHRIALEALDPLLAWMRAAPGPTSARSRAPT